MIKSLHLSTDTEVVGVVVGGAVVVSVTGSVKSSDKPTVMLDPQYRHLMVSALAIDSPGWLYLLLLPDFIAFHDVAEPKTQSFIFCTTGLHRYRPLRSSTALSSSLSGVEKAPSSANRTRRRSGGSTPGLLLARRNHSMEGNS